MPSADLPDGPDQFDQLAKMLRALMLMESMPRLQLSSTSEREDMRQAIDSGIDILANLKSYRNALASISFLPDELLSDIFYMVMIAEDAWSTMWCRLIFVCRRWHRIVMDNGRFWSWISEGKSFRHGYSRMKVWEKRSKGYPLSLKFRNKQSTPLFTRNSHRVRLLNVDGPKSDFIHFFGDVRDLPMLESLHVSLRNSNDQPATPIYLPSFLVQGGAPRLRLLCLDNVSFESGKELQLLANLTHLELTREIENREMQPALPSLEDFYNTIKLSPALHSLKIRHYVRIPSAVQHLPLISLPVLRFLDLNMDIQIVSSILRFLVFPHTTQTSFIAYPTQHDDYIQGVKSLMIHVRRHLRHKDAPVLRSANIVCGNYLAFSFSHNDTCPNSLFASEKPLHRIHLYPASQRENRQMIVKIINALPLEKLVVFDAMQVTCNNIEPDTEFSQQQFSQETWRTLVRLLPVGITIRIGVNNAMLALLSGAIDAMKRAPDTFPSGRRLKRLHRQQGVGSLALSNLVLLPSHNIPFRLHGTVDTPDQERLYNGLLDHLVKYRDLNTQLKPKGQPLEALLFEDVRLPFARQFAERLYEVTGVLSYDDIVWDPVKIRQEVRHSRKKMRRLRRTYPELGFSESDPDLSSLSSDSEIE
ncbi:hypothetical protein C8J55DRAFT_555620 [Lentinula edodes]|uniref:F-box domain-containing protein n=1 Tax=Lentinula lateritia TaxID=40482 RepID=A0A9W9DZX5_9AGAR|nr:hypothetical protein C8J55DRAFT_555620 [Lentinula edodes]